MRIVRGRYAYKIAQKTDDLFFLGYEFVAEHTVEIRPDQNALEERVGQQFVPYLLRLGTAVAGTRLSEGERGPFRLTAAQSPFAVRDPTEPVGQGQRCGKHVAVHFERKHVFEELAFARLVVYGEGAWGTQKEQVGVEGEFANGKGGGQGSDEEPARGLQGELDRSLHENGGKTVPETFLRDGAQGEIGGREVAGVDRDTVFKEIDLATRRGRETDFFGEEEPDRERTFGGETDENAVFQRDFGVAFETVGHAEIGVVHAQGAGHRG